MPCAVAADVIVRTYIVVFSHLLPVTPLPAIGDYWVLPHLFDELCLERALPEPAAIVGIDAIDSIALNLPGMMPLLGVDVALFFRIYPILGIVDVDEHCGYSVVPLLRAFTFKLLPRP